MMPFKPFYRPGGERERCLDLTEAVSHLPTAEGDAGTDVVEPRL